MSLDYQVPFLLGRTIKTSFCLFFWFIVVQAVRLIWKPRKSIPSFICVMRVFCSLNSSPLIFRNLLSSLWHDTRISLLLPVITTSSAYYTTLILGTIIFFFLPHAFIADSIPFNATLHNIGEIIPPWGVPSFVAWRFPSSMTPHLSHWVSTSLSHIGVCWIMKSWLILSKHLEISASNIQFGEYPLSK